MEIKVCPKCGSTDVDYLGYEALNLPTKYKCNKCEYEGLNFPSKDEKE